MTMLQFIKPIIVLTYIDNNSIYHWLCRNYKNSKFIAVQNGIRQVLGNERYKKYRHDIFYCYGEYDIEKHKQLGCSCNEAHPIGSLRAGLIRNESDINIKKYDICLISSDGRRDPDLIKDQNIRKIALENRKIDLLIKKYYEENNIKLIIALSPGTNHEKEYFRGLFGNDIEFSEIINPLSSYQLLQECNLAVSFMSTMLIEALALNCKSMAIHFQTKTDFFDYPNEIIHIYNDYGSFSKSLSILLNMDNALYQKSIAEIKNNIINNNPKNPPHNIIKNHISRILN